MSRTSIRLGIRLLLTLSLALPLAKVGWAQQGASADGQFAAYHNALSGAADGLLAATAQPMPLRPDAQARIPLSSGPLGSPQGRFDERRSLREAVQRVQQLRPMLEPILREEGLPTELTALVLVESGGRTTALSPKGALGLWQLMPETARRYGLVVSPARDERMEIAMSTRAAARYLRDLYAQFGDWHLVFAAYNAGEQAVARAIERSGVSDFGKISGMRLLPPETRNYVPAVHTALQLFGGGRLLAAAMAPLRTQPSRTIVYAAATIGN